ncbi:hypothetical protein BC830DRAFT_25069 [Chytriomyces sp. MP71]|nr:hypothetical protein BC830DRAFT_25069 [Chytriomyces sp. MP71]
MDLEELRHRTVFWTAETGACGTEASAMSEGCGGESSPRDVDWMTAFVVAVRAQTEEETAETAESSDPQQCIDSLARLLITRPFPVLLTRAARFSLTRGSLEHGVKIVRRTSFCERARVALTVALALAVPRTRGRRSRVGHRSRACNRGLKLSSSSYLNVFGFTN